MTRNRIVLLGAVVIVVVVFVLLRSRGGDALEVEVGQAETQTVFRSYVSASGEILAERYADVGSSVMGRVVELPVAEGQEVAAGDLLARIDPVQARSDLEAADAAIRALESDVEAAGEQVAAARADLQLAEAQEREAAANRKRLEALFEQQLIAAAEVDAVRAAAESGVARVSAARAAVSRARSAMTSAQRRVTQARAQATRARDVFDKTAIVSPIDGVVSRLQVREGEMVVIGIQNQPGTVLLTVSDLSQLNAEVRVAEADVLRVQVGQEATVTLEALPGRRFRGRVTEVGASALPELTSAAAAAREFRVEIRLLDPDPTLRPGLTCDVEILVGEKENVTSVPLQAVVIRRRGGDTEERGVFSVDDGVARFVPVETGLIGGLDIEVQGLESGQEIIIGPYQALRELEDGDQVAPR